MRCLLILLLSSSCLAASKYQYEDPQLDDEVQNIYFKIGSVLKGDVRISSATITDLTYGSIHPSISGTIGSICSVTQTTQTTTTSTSFVDTGLICKITPASTSSRIAIFAVGTIGIVETQSADNTVAASLFNSTTDLSNGQGFVAFDVNLSAVETNTFFNIPVAMFWIDSPGSVSEQTYTVRIKTNAGAVTARWNNFTGTSSLWLVEIKA